MQDIANILTTKKICSNEPDPVLPSYKDILPLTAPYPPALLLLRDHWYDLPTSGVVGVADGVGVNSGKPSRISPTLLKRPHNAPLMSVPMSLSSSATANG
jgi:hypothetical protein